MENLLEVIEWFYRIARYGYFEMGIVTLAVTHMHRGNSRNLFVTLNYRTSKVN